MITDQQRNRLESFKELKEGWLGTNGLPISHYAIARANQFLDLIDDNTFHVYPAPNSGIQVECDEWNVNVSFDPDGLTHVTYAKLSGEYADCVFSPEVKLVSILEIIQLLRKI